MSFLDPKEICVQEGISHLYTELHKVSLENPPNTLIFFSSSSVSIFSPQQKNQKVTFIIKYFSVTKPLCIRENK